jgi:hypothetical protein
MILLSNVGLAKTIHLCMGMEMESAIGFSTKTIDCGISKDEADCCDEEFELLVLDQELQKSTLHLDYSPLFVLSLIYTFLGISIFPSETNENYTDYPPLVLRQNLQVLHQSFLI